MRSILLLIILFPFVSFGQINQEIKKILDAVIAHTEEASLYRQKVDWTSLKAEMYAMSAQANSIDELVPAFNLMFERLEDTHGRVFYQRKPIAYYMGPTKEHQKKVDPEIYQQIQYLEKYPFTTKLLNDNVGYIRIVGLMMGDNEEMAKEIQNAVCDLIKNGADRFVLDLRYNGGGNMHPMLEGLTAILGKGIVGGSDGLTSDENSVWEVKKGDFYYDDFSIQLKESCKVKGIPNVAVLQSEYTASSGEVVAICFKGRKNTRFFGAKSYGLTSVTDWTVFNDSTFMTVSTGYYQDRIGKVYKEYVDVDEEFDFVKEPLSERDKTLERALEWLAQ